MERANKMVRLCRALSGLTQEQFEAATGIPNVGAYEQGIYTPSGEQLARCAKVANRSLEAMEWLLTRYERWESDGPAGRRSIGPGTTPPGLSAAGCFELGVREFVAWAAQAGHLAREERMRQREAERGVAASLLTTLEPLADKERRAVVRSESGYRTWALAALIAEHSEKQASKDVTKAMEWASLGCYIAERIEQPEPLRLRTLGWCRGHLANVYRVSGSHKASDAEIALAEEIWESGADPDEVLDPGRLLELKASLRSNQGRPEEALRLLAQAAPISRRQAHVTLKKGKTLTQLGEYEEAVAVLLGANDLIERQREPRLRNVQQFSLCRAFCHLNRYGEAAELLPAIRRSAAALGDELDLYRILWIDGRIARGLGDRDRAMVALEAAAAAFDGREMRFDAALARFEVATLHLEMGRPERSAEIVAGIVETFKDSGDFEEARKAVELFREAVEARRATIELAVSILEFLFLAQHRRELVFGEAPIQR
jgi:tetratricopeptide (TPR) repeat protein